MNKSEFLKIFENRLKGIPDIEKRDIIADYSEHFDVGIEKGEKEEVISKNLGDPAQIAKLFTADYFIEKASTSTTFSSVFKAILAFISLGLFNLIVVLGPFMFLLGLIVTLWITTISLSFVGGTGIIFGIVSPFIPYLAYHATFSSVFFILFLSFGLLCTGVLGSIGLWYLTKWFLIGTLKYLKFNLDLISK